MKGINLAVLSQSSAELSILTPHNTQENCNVQETVILSAAKNLVWAAIPREILRCAQNDGRPVNG